MAPSATGSGAIGAMSNTAPVVPFHLATQPILPTVSPLTALRVEAGADNAVPIAGLAVEIVARAQDGAKRFEIRLDPPELGRIDVRLDVDQAGKVTSRLMVERAETLDLLRRDAPQLERALQHAGLNTEGGLEFSLRDQSSPIATSSATRNRLPPDHPGGRTGRRRGGAARLRAAWSGSAAASTSGCRDSHGRLARKRPQPVASATGTTPSKTAGVTTKSRPTAPRSPRISRRSSRCSPRS